jgi:hypothetical protein
VWAQHAVFSAHVGRHEVVYRGMLHPANQSNIINAHRASVAGMAKELPPHFSGQSERQPCCPAQQARQHNCQAGGRHGVDQYVQLFLSKAQEKILETMDVADEEGEMVGLLQV